MTRSVPPGRPTGDPRSGFVLGLVVLMLFAIAVAGAAGFQLVSTEFTLAVQGRDGQKALVVARAGLSRFLGEQIGAVGDSISYAIGDGIATVTTRKVLEQDSLNHLYYVRSEGTVSDLFSTDPAARVVGTYAWHRIAPIPLKAMILMTDSNFEIRDNAVVSGLDQATTSDCSGGGTVGVYGVGTGGTVRTRSGGQYYGYPGPEDESYNNFAQVYDTMNIRWDILTDPNFPVDFNNSSPYWPSLPSDSFPLVRYTGNQTLYGWSGPSGGQGVLIVTGELTPSWAFSWDGIILAGSLGGNASYHHPYVRGMVLAGMAGNQSNEDLRSGSFLYHSCFAYAANRSLSYLEVVDNTVFEAN